MVVPLLLFWGSFLNFIAYRLVTEIKEPKLRIFCPHCKKNLFWYDNIPVLSWFIFLGKCRRCRNKISLLYPLIELFTLGAMLTLWSVPSHYFIAYFVFFSALIISIRSDLETMLISRFVTLFLIPVGLVFAGLELLPITLLDSVAGTMLGYGSLFIISKTFFLLTKKEGIGEGDLELLAFIGSFLGFIGCWVSLFVSAIIGSIVGVLYIVLSGQSKEARVPFGPFLAIGAMLFVIFQKELLFFLFPFK